MNIIYEIKNTLKNIKNSINSKIRYYTGTISLILYSVINYFKEKKGKNIIRNIIIMQIYFTGNMALKIITVVAFAIGSVTILQLFTQLSKVGALEYVGTILNIVIIRELSPLFTALIVISRSGTAIAAEIGTMMINDEVNALEIIGIDTLRYIVFPRIAGMVISMVLLTIYFNAIGILGGMLVGILYGGISFDMFIQYVMNSITIMDIFASLLKSAVFGVFTATISVFYGFQAYVSTHVPQVTTKAVVSSIFAMFFWEVIINLVFFV